MPNNQTNLIGSIFEASYAIISRVGEGGMGSVYKATQLSLNRTVAIKFLNQHAIAEEESLKRFYREGKNLSVLSHTNIISFYQFGVTDSGVPYIVMELAEGEDLSKILARENGLPWQIAITIAIQVCNAMETAHKHNIINRDIKPSNLIIKYVDNIPSVKIIDFGLAGFSKSNADEKDAIAEQKLTETGLLMGSTLYMSPEQVQGQTCTSQSDIYSLGCVLYEMLAGSPPFEANNAAGVWQKHVHELPQRFEQKAANKIFPSGLEKCVFKAMAKDPADRYQTMSEFSADLDLVRNTQGENVSADTQHLTAAKPRAQTGRKRIRPAAIAAVMFSTLLALFVLRDTVLTQFQLLSMQGCNDSDKVARCISSASCAKELNP